jgi:tryptophan-rich hypothetical protein
MPVRLNPRKLLHSKWTAVQPRNKEKHFMVTRVVQPDTPDLPITHVEIEAVHSQRSVVMPWRDLTDTAVWKQGWH